MGVQIAPGMAYLEMHYFIHGNLAAKSVVIKKSYLQDRRIGHLLCSLQRSQGRVY